MILRYLVMLLAFGPAVAVAQKQILFYDPVAALAYAKKWCEGGNACKSGKDGQFQSDNDTDCTHFMAHVLHAGGVKVPGVGASCKTGLTIRAVELGEWFEKASKTYANVRVISGWRLTQAGDFAFAKDFVFRPWQMRVGENYRHAMMLAAPATEESAEVYSHTANKCGLPTAHFDTGKGVFYRIDPSPLDGTWVTDDIDGRFQLVISGPSVEWTEKRKPGDGETFSIQAKFIERTPGDYVLERPNDDRVLRSLGFADTTLLSRVIAAKPEASTLTLRWDGTAATVDWRGLSVRKNADGTFKELMQPSMAKAKTFRLKKTSK
jgi:hypothetical protein